jgi:hypothetical protein
MKKIIYLIVILAAGYAFSSCGKMDENFKEYVVPNGVTYPQKPDSLKISSGFRRVQLRWLKAKDPKVVKAKIFWNNYTDSLALDIPSNLDTIKVSINDLQENTYTFFVKTYDLDGNVSVPSEVTGAVYGDIYLASLVDRSISDLLLNGTDGTVTFNAAPRGMIFNEFRYTTNAGVKTILKVLPDEESVVCPDVKRREVVEYRSAFCPSGSIDTLYTNWSPYLTPFVIKLPKTGWVAEADSWLAGWGDGQGSQGAGSGGYPARTIDDDLNSAWHSSTSGSFDVNTNKNLNALPHWIKIDMLSQQGIYRLNLYRHPAISYAKTVRIYLSDTPDQASWRLVSEMTYPADVRAVINYSAAQQGRYLILYFPDSSSSIYSCFAEVDVFGS